MEDWKETILKLPENVNKGWTMAELNLWLRNGGRYHLMPEGRSKEEQKVIF